MLIGRTGPMKRVHKDAFGRYRTIRSMIVLAGDSETNIMSVDALYSMDKRRGYASNHLRFAAKANVMPDMRKVLAVANCNVAGQALYDKFFWFVVAPPLPDGFKAIFPTEYDGYEYECRMLTKMD